MNPNSGRQTRHGETLTKGKIDAQSHYSYAVIPLLDFDFPYVRLPHSRFHLLSAFSLILDFDFDMLIGSAVGSTSSESKICCTSNLFYESKFPKYSGKSLNPITAMAKAIHFNHDGSTTTKLLVGVNMVAELIGVTLGPRGRNVVLQNNYGPPSARLIWEMFSYARHHQPCIIVMDEIDAIGGRLFSEGTSADREIQRTLMELLNQLDGFDQLGSVKMIMATNRPDVLDPALLRRGRLDRKIEIPLPNEQSRMDILKIHAAEIAKHGEIDYEAVVKLAEAAPRSVGRKEN